MKSEGYAIFVFWGVPQVKSKSREGWYLVIKNPADRSVTYTKYWIRNSIFRSDNYKDKGISHDINVSLKKWNKRTKPKSFDYVAPSYYKNIVPKIFTLPKRINVSGPITGFSAEYNGSLFLFFGDQHFSDEDLCATSPKTANSWLVKDFMALLCDSMVELNEYIDIFVEGLFRIKGDDILSLSSSASFEDIMYQITASKTDSYPLRSVIKTIFDSQCFEFEKQICKWYPNARFHWTDPRAAFVEDRFQEGGGEGCGSFLSMLTHYQNKYKPQKWDAYVKKSLLLNLLYNLIIKYLMAPNELNPNKIRNYLSDNIDKEIGRKISKAEKMTLFELFGFILGCKHSSQWMKVKNKKGISKIAVQLEKLEKETSVKIEQFIHELLNQHMINLHQILSEQDSSTRKSKALISSALLWHWTYMTEIMDSYLLARMLYNFDPKSKLKFIYAGSTHIETYKTFMEEKLKVSTTPFRVKSAKRCISFDTFDILSTFLK